MTNDEILEKRMKELKEKAKAEEEAEQLKPKEDTVKKTEINSYDAIRESYETLSEKYSKGVNEVMATAYMEQFQAKGLEIKGFGDRIYEKLGSYFQKELLESVPEDNGLARMILKGYISQVEDDKDQILDFIKSEGDFNHGMAAQIENFLRDKVESPIKSAHMADVRRKASDDFAGFKGYLKNAADKNGVPFNLEKITTLEDGLKNYSRLMEIIKKRKEEEEKLKRASE